MTKYKNKSYSLRIKNELQDKVRHIANKEKRPINTQYEIIVEQYIQQYEKEHGVIELSDNTSQGGG